MSGKHFDDNIKEIICRRSFDDWAIAVQGRIQTVADLFAADAVYHLNCYVRFSAKLPHTPQKLKRGRPKNRSGSSVGSGGSTDPPGPICK